ncbi:MAG TPA: glycosyltransferase family 39 protein [archaeon]|nr:glycosyltransferase family 39 protein [archaeon]
MNFNDPKLKKILLFSILLLAFLLRFWGGQQVHFWDETVYLQHAEIISGLRENNFDEFSLRPPMLPIIFAAGILLWNSTLTPIIIVGLFASLAVLFSFFIVEKIYGFKTGIISASLVAFLPFLVEYSRFLLSDMPALMFLLTGVFFAQKFFDEKKDFFALISGLLFGMSFLTRFSVFSAIAAIGFCAFAIYGKTAHEFLKTKKYTLFLAGFFCVVLPYFIWAQFEFGAFWIPVVNALYAINNFDGTPFFYLTAIISEFSIIILLGVLLFVARILPAKREKNDLFFFAWFVVLLGIISISPHKEERYLVSTIAFPLAVMASRGLTLAFELKNNWKKIMCIIAVSGIAIFSFYPSFDYFAGSTINTEYTTEEFLASQYIVELAEEGDVLYTDFNYPVFAYYTKLKVVEITKYNYSEDLFAEKFSKNGIVVLDSEHSPLMPDIIELHSENFELKKDFGRVRIYSFEK